MILTTIWWSLDTVLIFILQVKKLRSAGVKIICSSSLGTAELWFEPRCPLAQSLSSEPWCWAPEEGEGMPSDVTGIFWVVFTPWLCCWNSGHATGVLWHIIHFSHPGGKVKIKWDLESRDRGSRAGTLLTSCTFLKPGMTILLHTITMKSKRGHEYWNTLQTLNCWTGYSRASINI